MNYTVSNGPFQEHSALFQNPILQEHFKYNGSVGEGTLFQVHRSSKPDSHGGLHRVFTNVSLQDV